MQDVHADIGRNEPCPCGSGQKYKRCCLATMPAPLSPGERYQRHRAMKDEISERIMKWSRGRGLDGQGARVAGDFHGGEPNPNVEEEDLPLFGSYLLWKWRGPGAACLGDQYLRAEGRGLRAAEREYVEQALREPLRFLLVEAVEPGETIAFRDVFTGETFTVYENLALRGVHPREILFAQCVCIEGVHSLEAVGSVRLPPTYLARVIGLRRRLAPADGAMLDRAALEAHATEMRLQYFEWAEDTRRPPMLSNTDGEPLEPHTLRYRLTVSPEQAIAALSSLALPAEEASCDDGTFDAHGNLTGVEFVWAKRRNKMHSSWDNTILGHLAIQGDRLTGEVNSAGRARRLRAQIKRRLGDGARFESETRNSVEAMLAAARQQPAGPPPERSPELVAVEKEMREQFMAAWLDTKVPLLDNKTPRQAVRDGDGREIVISLLAEFERRDAIGVADARRALGL